MISASIVALSLGLTQVGSETFTPATASKLCLDTRLRKDAAEAIGQWSQNYPFARVIIGNDGRFGDVGVASPAVIGPNFVVCGASYNLIKVGRDGKGYRVTMERFYFRVTAADGGYRVSLEDLPASLEGSNITSRELIGRFKINDRPYADILAENEQRLNRRR